jgi:hypothetical protein
VAPFSVTLQRTCAYVNSEPSSANRTRYYYVESTNAKALTIRQLGHFTAHIYCLQIMQSIFSLAARRQ